MQLALLLFETTAASTRASRSPSRGPSPIRARCVWCGSRCSTTAAGHSGYCAAASPERCPPPHERCAIRLGARRRPGHRPLRRTVRPAGLGHALEPDDRPGLDRHLDMLAVDLEDMRRAAHSVGGTLNDVFVASVTGGSAATTSFTTPRWRPAHHLAHLHPQDDDPTGGNRITLERSPCRSGRRPAARVRLTGERCRSARDERAIPFSNSIAAPSTCCPREWSAPC